MHLGTGLHWVLLRYGVVLPLSETNMAKAGQKHKAQSWYSNPEQQFILPRSSYKPDPHIKKNPKPQSFMCFSRCCLGTMIVFRC